ncbi:MAG: ABC transporter ATP-binding protein [Alphaproteobacteria bacterium]
MNDAFIRIADVSRYFGKVAALENVNFNIGRGEFFSLLGASGCGKTTLLRILAGIDHPSSGEIFLDGDPMVRVPANRRPTNMVFQSYAIFPHLNVRENIGYGLVYHNLDKAEINRRVEEALELVKLGGLGDRAAHQLSGGQRQRVALARALICRPKVLLLDEPLSALDKKLREEMQHELRILQRHVGITFVFVTHDQEEALTLSDRIAVMDYGAVLQIDTPKGLYERPNSRKVAEFIGTMNLFPGKIATKDNQGVSIDGGPLGPLAVAGGSDRLRSGDQVFVALRPEQISIRLVDEKAAAGAATRVSGRVEDVAYLGDRSRYLIQVDGLATPVSVFSGNDSSPSIAASIGDRVSLTWNPDSAQILPQ